MKLALIGAGNVGGALARRLVALGHQVTVLSRDPASPKLQPLLQASPGLTARTLAEGVGDADVVLLAVPFAAAASTLQALGELGGRIVVDCTVRILNRRQQPAAAAAPPRFGTPSRCRRCTGATDTEGSYMLPHSPPLAAGCRRRQQPIPCASRRASASTGRRRGDERKTL